MADNIQLNLGSGGDLLAADDDGTANTYKYWNGTSITVFGSAAGTAANWKITAIPYLA